LLGQTGTDAAREALVAVLTTAPARVQGAIAGTLAGNKDGAAALLAAVAGGKASARLLQDRAVETRLRETRIDGIEQRLAELTQNLEPADQAMQERIDRQLARLADGRTGGVEAGAAVFRKHCAACHQVGGEGARIGPQLDGVGVRGPERLLEDVLDPNRNVDQAFRTVTLALESGQVVSGLPLREEGEVEVLADGRGQEQRVAKAEVEERTASGLSLMPANLAEQVPDEELTELIRFLLSRREPGTAGH
jgi:putative heme-binding domain-containing protein